ncbi:MAG TPA: ABC transporter substrate-binding protein [Anaeromyxobacter sp.]
MTRALLLCLSLAPALAAAGVRPAYGGAIRVGVATAPRLADGAQGPGDAFVERATAAPLLELDAAGALAPGALAEVPLPEAGGRAFRLRLRPGLSDAAGRPLGAADVASRLAALLSPDAPTPDAWIALPVLGADALAERRAPLLAGVQVLSPTELLVTLAFPLPEFPWLLAATPLALRGAGPFVAQPRRAPQDALVLVRNDRHHLGRPFANEVRVAPVDPRAAARLLAQGGLELVVRPEAAGGRAGPVIPALAATVALLNPARLGAGAEAARSALAALDRTELARRFVRGPAEPLRTLVPPAILPGAPREDAPAPVGAALPARLALLADSSAPDQRALAERIQVKLFDRGIRATVDLADAARFRARLAAGDYDVALLLVPVQAVRPALAAGQVAFAARGAQAARRTMAALAGLEGDAALAAAARAGRALDLVPLVASGVRVSAGPALQGLAARADGALDPGALWLLRGGAP